MTVRSQTVHLTTRGDGDIIDITPEVAVEVNRSGISHGAATVFVTGSTAGITTIEFEPGLLADFKEVWNRIAPKGAPYQHDRAWGDGNGHSHLRASLLGASLTIPFNSKRLTLGTWQQIVLVDFDNRPRSREFVIQIIGE